eukprot:NODE_4701_length_635_cov_29.554608_g4041_i0.p1 GENE.NODE_4701_length_635_cov_29.554608_g4041_i0~~NODE_4701_length_635_cov_29.554608_g4041_i0.p1  ORF type:complete len:131 (-),score=29.59 NODE_4701_length_635_cov_29.554608_g4041_i0:124-516(-)
MKNPETTVGISFNKKEVQMRDGNSQRFHIWDTAGQERYRSLVSSHFKDAKVAILVYDVTRRDSFTNCEDWHKVIEDQCPADCVLVLVANKCDEDVLREVDTRKGEAFAQEKNYLYSETSATKNSNVEEMF